MPLKNPDGRSLFYILWAIHFFSFANSIYGQATITGTVSDRENARLPFSAVILLDARDSSMVKGTIASEAGEFEFLHISPGSFLIQATMVGFRMSQSNSFVINANDSLHLPMVLDAHSTTLNEVVVESNKQTFEQHPDKLVVNVSGNVVFSGANVLDILSRSPGVTVNGHAGTIGIQGKNGALVLLNGKQVRLSASAITQMLSGITASELDKIEIISNPSAKYDAQGDAGIINIVTRNKTEEGTKGTINLMAGYGLAGKYSSNFSIGHRADRLSVYAEVNHFHNFTRQPLLFARRLGDEYTQTKADREAEIQVQRSTIQSEYQVSEKTKLSATVAGFRNRWDMIALNISNTEKANHPFSTTSIRDDEVNEWVHYMGSLSVTHAWSKNATLKFDMDYLHYNNNNPHAYVNSFNYHDGSRPSFQYHASISKETPINMFVGKMDVEKKLGSVNYEGGIKVISTNLHNRVKVSDNATGAWQEDEMLSQQYDLRDDVLAIYHSVFFHLKSKITAQMGLRGERTYTHIDDESGNKVYHQDFWSLFPSSLISLKISEDQRVDLSYGRRITRPSYEDIAPFVVFIDPSTYFSGNPQLKPTLTTNIQAAYSLKQLLASLKYSWDKNSIANFQSRLDPVTQKTIFHSINVDRVSTISLNAAFPYDVTNWWTVQSSVIGYYQYTSTKREGRPINLSQFSAMVNSSHQFSLAGGYSAELSFSYSTPTLFGLYTMESRTNVSVGFQKTFSRNRGKVSLNLQDIFWTDFARVKLTDPSANLEQINYLKFESRIFRLSYTRDFGNNKVTLNQRRTASDSEKYRLKN